MFFRTSRSASYSMCSFLGSKGGLGMRLTTHIHLVRWLRINGATPQLLLYAFMECARYKEDFLTPCTYTRVWLSIYSQNNSTHTESISNVHLGSEQLFVSYSRGHRLVLKQRPANTLRYFVVFLSTTTQIPAQNITLDHDDFLPQPFQFIMHTHRSIRCCSLSYWQRGNKKQYTLKQKLTELNWDNTHLAQYSPTKKPNMLPTPRG
jgi:hypothetical protein